MLLIPHCGVIADLRACLQDLGTSAIPQRFVKSRIHSYINILVYSARHMSFSDLIFLFAPELANGQKTLYLGIVIIVYGIQII